MKSPILGFMMTLALLSLFWKSGVAADGVLITSPRTGDALQGLVIINGSTDVGGFQSAEVSFNYLGGSPQNWFLIQQSKTAVRESALAVWDTTTIADGIYRLRVQVLLQDGRTLEAVVDNLRVRNYTPIETKTPESGLASVAPDATPTRSTPTPRSTPSPFPANPLEVKPVLLSFSLVQGIAAALVGLVLLGLYARAKKRRR